MRHWPSVLLFVAALLSLSMAGCGGKAPQGAASTIGAKGGSLSVSDSKSPLRGTSLQIAPGALRADTAISISIAPKGPKSSRYQSGPDIVLGPDGTTFSQPAMLTVPFLDRDAAGRVIPTEFLKIWQYDPSSDRWFAIETRVDLTAKTVSAPISHFSLYRVWALRYEQNSTVTYKINSLPTTRSGSDADSKAAVTRAFATWSSVAKSAGIRFEETQGSADITFHAGGRGNPVARIHDLDIRHMAGGAFLPTGRVDIYFNGAESGWGWAAPREGAPPAKYIDLESVALHEIGHALGLDHPYLGRGKTCVGPPVMCHNAKVDGDRYMPQRSLDKQDIDAFLRLYGVSQSAVPVAPSTSPTARPATPSPSPSTRIGTATPAASTAAPSQVTGTPRPPAAPTAAPTVTAAPPKPTSTAEAAYPPAAPTGALISSMIRDGSLAPGWSYHPEPCPASFANSTMSVECPSGSSWYQLASISSPTPENRAYMLKLRATIAEGAKLDLFAGDYNYGLYLDRSQSSLPRGCYGFSFGCEPVNLVGSHEFSAIVWPGGSRLCIDGKPFGDYGNRTRLEEGRSFWQSASIRVWNRQVQFDSVRLIALDPTAAAQNSCP